MNTIKLYEIKIGQRFIYMNTLYMVSYFPVSIIPHSANDILVVRLSGVKCGCLNEDEWTGMEDVIPCPLNGNEWGID